MDPRSLLQDNDDQHAQFMPVSASSLDAIGNATEAAGTTGTDMQSGQVSKAFKVGSVSSSAPNGHGDAHALGRSLRPHGSGRGTGTHVEGIDQHAIDARLRKIFDQLDEDGSGELSVDELAAFISTSTGGSSTSAENNKMAAALLAEVVHCQLLHICHLKFVGGA